MADVVSGYLGTARRWIQDALGGTIPIHAGTMPHSAWLAYRAAVKAFKISHSPQEKTISGLHQDCKKLTSVDQK